MIGFFGSRMCRDYETIRSVLRALKDRANLQQVVTGDCRGVDKLTYRACKELGIPVRVFVVENNPLGYSPERGDIVEVVRAGDLRVALRERTKKLVKYVKEHGGMLVGYQVNGKGSQLAIRTARELGVLVFVVDRDARKLRRHLSKPAVPQNPQSHSKPSPKEEIHGKKMEKRERREK